MLRRAASCLLVLAAALLGGAAPAAATLSPHLRYIWPEEFVDDWAKTDENLRLFRYETPGSPDQDDGDAVIRGRVELECTAVSGAKHICPMSRFDGQDASAKRVAAFNVAFYTFYWEQEIQKLETDCKAAGSSADPNCKILDAVVQKFNVNAIDNDSEVEMTQGTNNAWQCTKCDGVPLHSILGTDSQYRPAAVIQAKAVLLVAEENLSATDLPVLVIAGYGGLGPRLAEAAKFVVRNDAAAFVVLPPGELGGYSPGSILASKNNGNHWDRRIDFEMADLICNPTSDAEKRRVPQPCLFFRDLTGWSWSDSYRGDAWKATTLRLLKTIGGIDQEATELPLERAGPIEFQSSDFHDVVDAEYPQDSWFYRAAFAMMRGLTFIEAMDNGVRGSSGLTSVKPRVPMGAVDPDTGRGDSEGTWNANLIDNEQIGLAASSRGGILGYIVNGIDDRLKGVILSGTGGLFRTSYDEEPFQVSIESGDPYVGGTPGDEASCEYNYDPKDSASTFTNPFRAGTNVIMWEEGEIDEAYWQEDCRTLGVSGETPPSECTDSGGLAKKLYDPSWNDDSSLKHAQLAWFYCDEDFDTGLSPTKPFLSPGNALTPTVPKEVVFANDGVVDVNANVAQVDRETCNLPAYTTAPFTSETPKQVREYTHFNNYFDPLHYLFSDPDDLVNCNPLLCGENPCCDFPKIWQHAPILLVLGAQDQVFPINSATETFRYAAGVQEYVDYIIGSHEGRSFSVIQLVSNWDHPAFYALPGRFAVSSDLGANELVGLGVESIRQGGTPGFTQVGIGGTSFHPLADYVNRYAAFGSNRSGAPTGVEVFSRFETQGDQVRANETIDGKTFQYSRGSATADLFFAMTMANGAGLTNWESPTFTSYDDGGDLIEVTATYHPGFLTAGGIIPTSAGTCVEHELRLAISFDRGFTYNANTVYTNPFTDTRGSGQNYGATCDVVNQNAECRRQACETSETIEGHIAKCAEELNFCREPFKMFLASTDGSGVETWTTAVAVNDPSGQDPVDTDRWPYRIVKPGVAPFDDESRWPDYEDSAYPGVENVVAFIEVLATYQEGCSGSCSSCTNEKKPLYFTTLPATPPGSHRRFEFALSPTIGLGTGRQNIATPPATEYIYWFEPRLRTVGSIGPGSGDTCCSFAGELTKPTLTTTLNGIEIDAELISYAGDFIGDSCGPDRFATPGEAELNRMRYHTWVGTGDGDDGSNDGKIFVFRRAPHLADNDWNGIGNYCESSFAFVPRGTGQGEVNWDQGDANAAKCQPGSPKCVLPEGNAVPGGVVATATCGTLSAGPGSPLAAGAVLGAPLLLVALSRRRRR